MLYINIVEIYTGYADWDAFFADLISQNQRQDRNIDELDKKIKRVDDRITNCHQNYDQRFKRIEQQLVLANERIRGLESSQKLILERMNKLESDLQGVKDGINNLTQMVISDKEIIRDLIAKIPSTK